MIPVDFVGEEMPAGRGWWVFLMFPARLAARLVRVALPSRTSPPTLFFSPWANLGIKAQDPAGVIGSRPSQEQAKPRLSELIGSSSQRPARFFLCSSLANRRAHRLARWLSVSPQFTR